jgi:hypothetical protein
MRATPVNGRAGRIGLAAGAEAVGLVVMLADLLRLPLLKISAGIRNPLVSESRAPSNGLPSGKVKIGGMLRHPLRLVCFTRLMSVDGQDSPYRVLPRRNLPEAPGADPQAVELLPGVAGRADQRTGLTVLEPL